MLNKTLALTALAAFIIAPTAAMAGESSSKVNYAAKKKGIVAFESGAKTDAKIMAEDTTAFNPADIEPAAGGDITSEIEEQGDAMAKSMKLPRK